MRETGERVLLAGRRATHTDIAHVRRYEWARGRVAGRILDVACGSGYGTAMLAELGPVTGVDRDEDALRLARSRSSAAEFQRVELPELPFADASFDAVVSFETVEHVDDDVGFLREVRRVLRPDGALLLSTPNRDVTSPDGPPANPFHVREYRLDELLAMARAAGFGEPAEVLGQGPPAPVGPARVAARVVARFPALCRPGTWWDRLAHGSDRVERWDDRPTAPTIWVVRWPGVGSATP
jgi:SAM-dependent methyltransferase